MEAAYSWMFHNVGAFVVAFGSVLAVAFLLVGVWAVCRQVFRYFSTLVGD